MNICRNYQKELEKILREPEASGTAPPSLLLHSCCAPCSSYCMEYLSNYFKITVFYYNPNITEREEYRKRVEEEKRLIEIYNRRTQERGAAGKSGLLTDESAGDVRDGKREIKTGTPYKIKIIEGSYEPERFLEMAAGLENCDEGGERCFRCYALRLGKTAELAREKNFDYFTTTLTISPLKNAVKLNEIGERLAEEQGVRWLPSDFKKRGGYQRSIELSKEYGLYRQNYCGCVFSKREQPAGRSY